MQMPWKKMAEKSAGMTAGAMQLGMGLAKKRQADRMAPDIIDPNRVRDLEEARRKQASLEAGTDTATQQALKQADQSTRATQRDLGKVTGGNVGGTVSAMLQAQRMGGGVTNQAYADAANRGAQMSALSNQIAKEISQRKLDIQQFRSVQRRAEGAQQSKQGFQNLAAQMSLGDYGQGMGSGTEAQDSGAGGQTSSGSRMSSPNTGGSEGAGGKTGGMFSKLFGGEAKSGGAVSGGNVSGGGGGGIMSQMGGGGSDAAGSGFDWSSIAGMAGG